MPYNPQTHDRSGEILAAGITQGTNTLAGSIIQLSKDLKRTKALKQVALDVFGMEPDEVDNMTLPQLEGKVTGLAVQHQKQQVDQANAQARFRDSLGAMMQPQPANYVEQNPAMVTPQIGAEQVMRAGLETGALDPATALRVMDQRQNPTPWQSPSGNDYVVHGNSILRDTQFDPNMFMSPGPAGYDVVMGANGAPRYLPQRDPLDSPGRLTSEWLSRLDSLETEMARAQQIIDSSDSELVQLKSLGTPEEQRARAKRGQQQTKNQAKFLVGVLGRERVGQPETLAEYSRRFGLEQTTIPSQATTGQSGKVLMIAPDGRQGYVPASQVEQAQAEGYQPAP